MWVCKKHVTDALALLTTPHIQKATYGVSCSFCKEEADVNLYYAHRPSRLKRIKYTDIDNPRIEIKDQIS